VAGGACTATIVSGEVECDQRGRGDLCTCEAESEPGVRLALQRLASRSATVQIGSHRARSGASQGFGTYSRVDYCQGPARPEQAVGGAHRAQGWTGGQHSRQHLPSNVLQRVPRNVYFFY
jgi:hypothetical protein